MNIRQLALLVDHEITIISNKIGQLQQLSKDQAKLDPDPKKLLQIQLQIAAIINEFGTEGENLILAIRPEFKKMIEGMKSLYQQEKNRIEKHNADLIAQAEAKKEEAESQSESAKD